MKEKIGLLMPYMFETSAIASYKTLIQHHHGGPELCSLKLILKF